MWPFRRKEQAPAAIPTPVIRSDWKKMPALQRAIGEHPLTAPGELFADELATRHDPSVVSRTLGHRVSAEGPSGLVLAVGSTSTRSDGPAMTTRPRIQRRAAPAADAVEADLEATDAPTAGGTPAELTTAGRSPAELTTPGRAPAELTTAGGVPTELPATSPSVAARPAASTAAVQTYRRELPIVATAEPVIKNLTGLAPDATPPPVGPGRKLELQRSVAPSSSAAPKHETSMASLELSSASTPAKLTLGQSRRLGLGAPLRQVPAASLQRAAAAREITTPATSTTGESSAPAVASIAVTEVAGPSSSPVTPVAERTSLDAPSLTYRTLQKIPAAAEADPTSVSDFTGPRPSDSGPTESRSPINQPPGSSNPLGAQGSLTASRTERREPALELPLQRVVREAPLEKSAPAAAPAQKAPPIVPAASTPTIETTAAAVRPLPPASARSGEAAGLAPIAAARDLRTASVQRLSDHPATTPELSPAGGYTLPLVARSRELNTPGPAGANQDETLTQESASVAQPADMAEATTWTMTHSYGPPESSTSSGALSNSAWPSQPSAQRSAAPLRPLSLAVQRQPAEPAPLREASRPLTLAPVATMASIQRAQVATMESVQTAIAESTAPVAFQAGSSGRSVERRATNLQRAEDEPALDSAPTSSSVASAPAPGAPEHASGLASESEMDALAGRLYERIRGRLKSELLVDRERAGLLTDLR